MQSAVRATTSPPTAATHQRSQDRQTTMLANFHPVPRFLLILAVALALSCAPYIAAAQSVPMLVQAETMTLVAPMAAGYGIAAMGGRFISVPSGANPANPTPLASVQVNV